MCAAEVAPAGFKQKEFRWEDLNWVAHPIWRCVCKNAYFQSERDKAYKHLSRTRCGDHVRLLSKIPKPREQKRRPSSMQAEDEDARKLVAARRVQLCRTRTILVRGLQQQLGEVIACEGSLSLLKERVHLAVGDHSAVVHLQTNLSLGVHPAAKLELEDLKTNLAVAADSTAELQPEDLEANPGVGDHPIAKLGLQHLKSNLAAAFPPLQLPGSFPETYTKPSGVGRGTCLLVLLFCLSF